MTHTETKSQEAGWGECGEEKIMDWASMFQLENVADKVADWVAQDEIRKLV